MARACAICGKSVKSGHNSITKFKGKTKRMIAPNLQPVHAIVNLQPVKLSVCTRCLRSGKVQRA
ncbi:MAG: 50S ribosomal protein L28 [Symbiobacteriaceae bacterium]|nr:50S ribosomal protein L28 [Symbiobacteriaceae bacterium]